MSSPSSNNRYNSFLENRSMFIDPHVHCRDGKQSYKETIVHALSVAERAGFTAIFDMPNTDPPIFTFQQAKERIELASKAKSPVWYGLYVGLTAGVGQIKEAVRAHDTLSNVVGFKLYAGHSVGKIGVTTENEQKLIYKMLAELGYTGVIAVHCEKDSLLKPYLWDPLQPSSHAAARPPSAEVESVKDQITFAREAGFKGTLHIAHISVPEAVDIVDKARKTMNITCGVTPHHCLFGTEMLERKNGLLYKMNPPLRIKSMAEQMRDYLKEGKIDWIETDHAPHTQEEKQNEPYLSGVPGLPFYPRFIEFLKRDMSAAMIKKITFDNIIKNFWLELKQREAVPALDLTGEYPFDVYAGFIWS